MKKLIPLFFLFFVQLLAESANAQVKGKITFSDTFVYNTTYCPSNSQYSGWGAFRAKLDTTNYKILSVTMKGTYDVSGRTCADSFIARKLAERLKNPVAGSDLAIKCDGYTWVIAGIGTCFAGGCASSADNVGVAADGQTYACNCISSSYQMRPIIGNANWGGINTASCPGPSQRMTLDFEYRLYPYDASVSSVSPPDLCANPNKIVTTIKNYGSKTLDSIRINWSVNGLQQSTIYLKKKILSLKDTSLTLITGLFYTPYSNYTIKVWTSKPNGLNDNYTNNDTLTYRFTYTGTPSLPNTNDTTVCGSGKIKLYGQPANKNDTLLWYNSKSGNTILGVGRYFKTPFLSPGTYKYYLGAAGQLANASLQTTFSGGNQQAGFMLDVKALGNNSIDSLGLNIGAPSGTAINIEVYYRDGSYSGFETNQSAWSVLGKYTVTSKGAGNATTIPARISIPAGKTYGFYVQTTNAPSYYLQYGNISSSINSDSYLQIITGVGVGLNWGTTFTGRNGNIRFYYKTVSCLSARDSIKLTVERKPSGASLSMGFPFNSPSKLTRGSKADPDIVAVGKELNYELNPPKGYDNNGYGTKWKVTDIRIVKLSGKSIPNGDTAIKLPSAASNGKIRLIPDYLLEDSIITIYTTISDLTTTKCDTVLQRIIYVAPTPTINFTFANACLGIPIEFKNHTNIRSGTLNYKWDFGNGDSSFLINPVYNYPSHGIYNVKLTAKSNFGIIKDTIIKLTIYEIPNVTFKVINACIGDSLSFINNTSISIGTIAYKWDLGDGKTSIKPDFKYRYFVPGSYIVSLTATANGCSNSLSKKANQFVRPKADFTITGNCSKNPIVFKNKTTINLGENFGSNWKFGDGGGNNDHNPSYIYNTPGDKIVKYIATSQFGCTDSMIKTLTILSSPTASFTNGPVCNVKPVLFNNTSIEPLGVVTSYLWNFGDGETSTIKSPLHHYAVLGFGTIKLVATGENGCSTTFEKLVNVLPQPVANFEALDACTGANVIFTNKTKGGGLINFKWNFGDGDSSVIFSPTKKYNVTVASTFNVTLTAKNIGGCQDAITIPVNIKETPKCGFTYHSSGTGGYEFTFVPANISYPLYQWNFEGGGNYNTVSPKHKFATDGKYRVTAYMKNADGCDCVDSTHYVIVNHVGINDINKNTQVLIFPNPNKGEFYVQLPSNDPKLNFDLNLYSVTGQHIYSIKLKGNQKHFISVPNLSNGIYVVEITQFNGFNIKSKLAINR